MNYRSLQDGDRIIVVFNDIDKNEKVRLEEFLSAISGSIPEYKQLQAVKPLPAGQVQEKRKSEPSELISYSTLPPVKSHDYEVKSIKTIRNPEEMQKLTVIELETMTVEQMKKVLTECTGIEKIKRDKILRNSMYTDIYQYILMAGEISLRDTCKKIFLAA